MKDIYIIFSATPYKMGKFIRLFAREKFNHVSVSFDRNLSCAYTFARRYINTPFFGGLVKDSPDRYFHKNKPAKIAVCRLEVNDETYKKIQSICTAMYNQYEEYLYNFLSAIGYIFKRRFPIMQAFTCAEFATLILSFTNTQIKKEDFYTVEELFDLIKCHTVYSGSADFVIKTGSFNNRCGLLKGFSATAASVFSLMKRI